ncbi:hypothetical protein Syun_003702 [Stephania yunnanensis]|uniref:Uncharacterized protein n=1 Tax=Stephania yunnanensis TaxID=152371 RepID=A0AAP0L2M6_9MAGN
MIDKMKEKGTKDNSHGNKKQSKVSISLFVINVCNFSIISLFVINVCNFRFKCRILKHAGWYLSSFTIVYASYLLMQK